MSTVSTPLHPDAVLYPEGASAPSPIPCVDHYAGSEKLMRKALALQAERGAVFDITLDCEDGAQVGAETQHASLVAALIKGDDNRYGRVGARIHDMTHPCWLTDMETIVSQAGARVAYITLPKARGLEDVRRALRALRDIELRSALHRAIPLHVLIETHQALHEVWQIAALPGVASLDFGIMDFVSAHHGALDATCMRSPAQFDHPLMRRAKTEIAAAALAHGKLPTHSVCTDFADPDTVYADARRARHEFGYLRMWSIHPAQIDPILRAMQPANESVEEAAHILLAAQDAGWGPTQYQGRLHDRASYRYYWTLLRRAQATGVALPSQVQKRFFAEARAA